LTFTRGLSQDQLYPAGKQLIDSMVAKGLDSKTASRPNLLQNAARRSGVEDHPNFEVKESVRFARRPHLGGGAVGSELGNETDLDGETFLQALRRDYTPS
jgi:hypothetical protein